MLAVLSLAAASAAPPATWEIGGATVGAQLGRQVASAGDVNGDGFDDVLVAIPQYDVTPSGREGAAAAYYGSPSGLPATADWRVTGTVSYSQGFSVAGAGDVNGDGFDDALVGAPHHMGALLLQGAVRAYLGGPAGLASAPAWTIEGPLANARMGWSVASAGDVDGDGLADVLVGAPGYSDGEAGEGAAAAFYGAPGGLPSAPDWFLELDEEVAALGESVASAGDVDGDGYDDAIIGAPDYLATFAYTSYGAALMYLGGAAGLQPAPAWSYVSSQPLAHVGRAVSSAGDVDGDGHDDVLVGAPGYENGESTEGAVLLFPGTPTGLRATPTVIIESNRVDAQLGSAVAAAGDLDGDGFDDALIGAPFTSAGVFFQGSAGVYRGTPAGLQSTPALEGFGGYGAGAFGYSVASAGDVDGDGRPDVLVGAVWQDYGGQASAGRAYLY